jgi:hypothetical protein
MPVRRCIKCSTEIYECMGSVLVRDVLDAEAGRIPYTAVREHCGLCTLSMILQDENAEGTESPTLAYLRSLPLNPYL